jgi:hypothetical protein
LSKQSPKSKPITEPAKTTEVLAKNSVVSGETSERKNLIKEITPEEKQKAHREGIIKTIVASALGIIAGLIASSLYGTGENKAWYAILMIVVGFTYFLQKLIYSQLNIDTIEFKFKDWFYVEFIVLDFFLVTWTLLLN